MQPRLHGPLAALALSACGIPPGSVGQFGTQGAGSDGGTALSTGDDDGDGTVADPSAATGVADTTDGTPKLDVGPGAGDGTGGAGCLSEDCCKVGDDEMDAPLPCDETAPPNSFDPEVQWAWWGEGESQQSVSTPLVANLTDDNGDGEIDLCDIPDVVVVTYGGDTGAGMYVLDGATGSVHGSVPDINFAGTPAIGDIDGDGVPEIVVRTNAGLAAFGHDLQPKWLAAFEGGVHIGLADLDNDGDVEIYHSDGVHDHEGNELWDSVLGAESQVPTAHDLDGDGDLEITWGRVAKHHDGTTYYENLAVPNVQYQGFPMPQVANLDDDPQPEILVTTTEGLTVLEHDGTIKFAGLTPTGDPAVEDYWSRAAAVHDFDGDGDAEFALCSADHYTVYHHDADILWSAVVDDLSGRSAGTAFDFLGAGVAQAMFADETTLHVFDEFGQSLLAVPRSSFTADEYPTVADVDNDGAAEIVVVSNALMGVQTAPTVQVIRDEQDRWVRARRIWNQHTYHVTNVREDGTIPQFEPPHWQHLNTFRTQAQIAGDGMGTCQPKPAG